MPAKTETVTGKVASLNDWKSGKGVWVNLEDNPNDFFAYKNKAPKLGEEGTWQVKEGTGIFSDKVELVKKQGGTPEKPAKQENPVAAIESADRVYLTRAEADAVRQNSIERQSAIKTAGALVGELYPREPKFDHEKALDNVRYIADGVLAWIRMDESKLPEPPEEPDEPDTGD